MRLWRKIRIILYDSFLFMLIYDLLEEALEDLLAAEVSNALSQMFSKVFCITITQTLKVCLKRMVKKLCYKSGDDKMKLLIKILKCLYYNKCTIVMTLLSVFSSYCSYTILPLLQWAKILISVSILGIGILCAINIGLETYDEIEERTEKEKANREEKYTLIKERKQEKRHSKQLKKISKELREKKYEEIRKREALLLKKEMEDFDTSLNEQVELEYQKRLKEKEQNINKEEKKEDIVDKVEDVTTNEVKNAIIEQ